MKAAAARRPKKPAKAAKKKHEPDILTVAEQEMETAFGSDGALPIEGTGAPAPVKKAPAKKSARWAKTGKP